MARRVVVADAYPHLEGGAQLLARRLAEGLVERGHRVTWLAPGTGAAVASATAAGIPVVVVPTPPALSRYGGTTTGVRSVAAVASLPGYWTRVRRALRAADVVHVNDVRALLLFGPPARACRVPVVYHRHWSPPAGLERRLLPLAAEVVVPSRTGASEVASRGRDEAHVVPGWLPPGPVPPRRDGSSRRVATVARLHPDKGVDTLVAAADLLRHDHPGLRVDVVGGRDPAAPGHADALEHAIATAGLVDTVRLHGARPDAWAVAGGCDVYVQPSRAETQGLALWQAMWLGRPVVASDLAAVREVVEDGVTGRLVPPGDATTLAAAIGELLADPDTAERLGSAAAAVIRDRVDADAVASILDVHERACTR